MRAIKPATPARTAPTACVARGAWAVTMGASETVVEGTWVVVPRVVWVVGTCTVVGYCLTDEMTVATGKSTC